MKKYILIICLICSFLISAQKEEVTPSYDFSLKTRLYKILPDSIYTIIEDNPIIFYSNDSSVYGSFWSLIVYTDNNYCVYSYNPFPYHRYIKRVKFDPADSASFFSANQVLFEWGFDTLAIKMQKMKAIEPKAETSIHDTITVIKNWDKGAYSTHGITEFSGPDSVNFNNKLHKLILTMCWLSDDDIRNQLPDSIMY